MKYVLITPARNEGTHIEKTIRSVTSQALLPVKWVIVSDGSVDDTDEIVKRYLPDHPFMGFLRVERSNDRDFASKIHAFNKGLELLRDMDYDYIGNLDADISFDREYYRNILLKFAENEKLGLAGGVGLDLIDDEYRRVKVSENSVMGGVQLFRISCFEQIGGLRLMKYGGEDTIAELMARMNGWQVKAFPEFDVFHNEETGSRSRGFLKGQFREGLRDYFVGYHPLFELFRCVYRMKGKNPYVFGVLTWLSGYCWAYVRMYKRTVPREVVKFLRHDQIGRLKGYIKGKSAVC